MENQLLLLDLLSLDWIDLRRRVVLSMGLHPAKAKSDRGMLFMISSIQIMSPIIYDMLNKLVSVADNRIVEGGAAEVINEQGVHLPLLQGVVDPFHGHGVAVLSLHVLGKDVEKVLALLVVLSKDFIISSFRKQGDH